MTALRFQAELDNYRKRVAGRWTKSGYAQVPLIGDLLPVLDNVGRAIEAAEKLPTPPACWKDSAWWPGTESVSNATIARRSRLRQPSTRIGMKPFCSGRPARCRPIRCCTTQTGYRSTTAWCGSRSSFNDSARGGVREAGGSEGDRQRAEDRGVELLFAYERRKRDAHLRLVCDACDHRFELFHRSRPSREEVFRVRP